MRNDSNLLKSNIRLHVDGRQKTKFSYSSATYRLIYRSGKFAYGRHTVRIVALDAFRNTGDKTWGFKISSS